MRYTEDMKLWLFDVAHGNLDDESILKGFIKHYVLQGQVIDNVVQDIMFHTPYGTDAAGKVKESVIEALNGAVHNNSKTSI